MSDQEKALGFNNNLKANGKKLHIQTAYSEQTQKAVSEVFDGGVLVDRREVVVSPELTEADLEKEVKQFHHLVLSDLEVLFHISDKVLNSGHALSLIKLATLFYDKGFYDEAMNVLDQALKKNADSAKADFLLGKCAYMIQEYDKAQAHIEKAILKNPDYPDLHCWLARVFWKKQMFSDALSEFDRALELNPDYHEAHYYFGLCLLYSKNQAPKDPDLKPPIERLKDAEKHLHKAAQLSDAYDKDLMQSGFEKLDLKDEQETGLDEFEKAYHPIRMTDKSVIAESEFYLKFMFDGLDKESKTLSHYIRTIQKSVAQYPEYADLRKSLGTAFLLKSWHYFIQAIEEHRKAIEINPDFERASKHLKLLENDSRGFLILLRAILK